MARTVTVKDEHGGLFRCTRKQWERLHQPAGRTLVYDEDGKPAASRKAKTPEPTADTGTTQE